MFLDFNEKPHSASFPLLLPSNVVAKERKAKKERKKARVKEGAQFMQIVCLVYLAGQLKNHNSGRSAKQISLWQLQCKGIPSMEEKIRYSVCYS